MKIRLQTNFRDCGISVIQALCAFWHNIWIDEDEIKYLAVYSKKGISGANLINLGKEFGIKLKPFQVEAKDLEKSVIKDYFVALVSNQNQKHFVIIKLLPKIVIIFDPINGKSKVKYQDFQTRFAKLIFIVEKIPFFYQKKSENNLWKIIFQKIDILIFSFAISIINLIIMFASSFFLKLIFDLIIPMQLKSTLLLITCSFIFTIFLRIIWEIIKNYLNTKINLYCHIQLTSIYYQKLFDAGINDLDKLTSSEHLHRINLIPEVSRFIANFHRIILEHSFIIIITSIICIWISAKMFMIILMLAILTSIMSSIFQIKFKSLHYQKVQKQITVFNYQIDIIKSFIELKNNNYLDFFKKLLAKGTNANFKLDYKIWKNNNLQHMIIEALTLLTPIIITFIGAHSIFENNFSVGSLLFFLSIIHHFLNALKNIINFTIDCKINFKHLKLLNFSLNFNKEENINGKNKKQNNAIDIKQYFIKNQNFKIKQIEIKNLTFAFDKPFLQIDDFKFDNNIHLVGENGSGKTTLLKIIGSYYLGDKQLIVNKIPLTNHFLNYYRQKIFYVNPLTHLPNCSIFEYITLNQPKAIKNFLNNCQQFDLFTLFEKTNIDLHEIILNNGQNFSSGQKQIIMMMRLLAFKFDIIMNDEGLENVDNQKIRTIKKAVKNFQQAIFIEISHGEKYLSKGKKITIHEIINRF